MSQNTVQSLFCYAFVSLSAMAASNTELFYWLFCYSNRTFSYNQYTDQQMLVIESSSSSSVICQTTGPKPLPKRFLHIVRSRASSFNWQYPLLSSRSPSSFLRLLPRLLHCIIKYKSQNITHDKYNLYMLWHYGSEMCLGLIIIKKCVLWIVTYLFYYVHLLVKHWVYEKHGMSNTKFVNVRQKTGLEL